MSKTGNGQKINEINASAADPVVTEVILENEAQEVEVDVETEKQKCKVDELDISKLEPGIEESKRRGFYEFYGTITGSAGKCKRFCITSIKESALPLQIEFVTENGRYIIQEWAGRMLAFEEESGWTMNECEFRPTFQSQMTARVVKDILDEGKASLTDYEDSMDLHLKYIIPLISYFNDNGIKGDICPIT